LPSRYKIGLSTVDFSAVKDQIWTNRKLRKKLQKVKSKEKRKKMKILFQILFFLVFLSFLAEATPGRYLIKLLFSVIFATSSKIECLFTS